MSVQFTECTVEIEYAFTNQREKEISEGKF